MPQRNSDTRGSVKLRTGEAVQLGNQVREHGRRPHLFDPAQTRTGSARSVHERKQAGVEISQTAEQTSMKRAVPKQTRRR